MPRRPRQTKSQASLTRFQDGNETGPEAPDPAQPRTSRHDAAGLAAGPAPGATSDDVRIQDAVSTEHRSTGHTSAAHDAHAQAPAHGGGPGTAASPQGGATTPDAHETSIYETGPVADLPPTHEPRNEAQANADADVLTQLDAKGERDRERLRRALRGGLESLGFRGPRVRLVEKRYPGLQASIERTSGGRMRDRERVTFYCSDGFLLASDTCVKGLAASLGLRVLPKRKHVPEMAKLLVKHYEMWVNGKEARAIHSALRRARARKQGRGPQGQSYDLERLRDRLAAGFLGDDEKVRTVRLTWSSRTGFRVFGHHDGDLATIVVSRALDHPDVPERLAAYVLYHELLHHVLGVETTASDRRRVHPPAFRRRERRFPLWEVCDEYLTFMATYRRPRRRANAPEAWQPLWDDDWDRPREGIGDAASEDAVGQTEAPRGQGTPAAAEPRAWQSVKDPLPERERSRGATAESG